MANPNAPGDGQDTMRAAHSTAVSPTSTGALPEWIQLLPAGTFSGVDGRGPYGVPDPDAVIRRTAERNGGQDLPIDYGHALEREGYDGDAAPAAGWISELEVRDDATIWGRVSWTDDGATKIRGRSFRFLSPVFYHDKDGTVLWIVRAGLTNRPNLRLKAVHSQRAGQAGEEQSDVADRKQDQDALAPVATALGLETGADAAAVTTRASHAAQAQAGLAKVAQSVQLGAEASADDIIQAINARAGGSSTAPDPAQFVSRHSYDTLASELKSAQAREGVRLIDGAVEGGKLAPAQREWAKSYHARDPQGFEQFLGAQPVIVQQGSAHAAGGSGGTGRELDADAKAVCATLGISAEDYLKSTSEEARI